MQDLKPNIHPLDLRIELQQITAIHTVLVTNLKSEKKKKILS